MLTKYDWKTVPPPSFIFGIILRLSVWIIRTTLSRSPLLFFSLALYLYHLSISLSIPPLNLFFFSVFYHSFPCLLFSPSTLLISSFLIFSLSLFVAFSICHTLIPSLLVLFSYSFLFLYSLFFSFSLFSPSLSLSLLLSLFSLSHLIPFSLTLSLSVIFPSKKFNGESLFETRSKPNRRSLSYCVSPFRIN